jgi:hypothetical protein
MIATLSSAGVTCDYIISPASAEFSAAGGSGSITVTATSGCPWTAAGNDAWINITGGSSGSGNGTVNYSLPASGSLRSGTVTVAGKTFTVDQGLLLNGDFITCNIPSGWTVVDNATTGAVWTFNDPGSRGNQTGGSGCFAITDSDYAGSTVMNTELRSPSFDASSLSAVNLEFKTDFRHWSSEVADVDVSVNGASGPWTNVWRKTGADYGGPHTEDVDISAQAAGHSDVVVRFHYYNAYYAYWWQVDDVKILGVGAPTVLTVSKTGTGSGTVESYPLGVSCGSDCTETYDYGTTVDLTATPSDACTSSIFSGDCAGSDTCSMLMIGNRNVIAKFFIHYVRVDGSDYYDESLQNAYDNAASSDVLRSRASSETGDLLFDGDKQVTVEGGYSDCTYSDNTGNYTTISGSAIIGGAGSGTGSVTIGNIAIK